MALTPEDVSNKRFTAVRLREGYDMGEVDQFLDEVEAELTRLVTENDELRAKLEAAQTGRPAYVVHPEPPAWLEDFWDRYSMSRWRPWRTPEPTPAFAMPHGDPAHVIARHLKKEIGA